MTEPTTSCSVSEIFSQSLCLRHPILEQRRKMLFFSIVDSSSEHHIKVSELLTSSSAEDNSSQTQQTGKNKLRLILPSPSRCQMDQRMGQCWLPWLISSLICPRRERQSKKKQQKNKGVWGRDIGGKRRNGQGVKETWRKKKQQFCWDLILAADADTVHVNNCAH